MFFPSSRGAKGGKIQKQRRETRNSKEDQRLIDLLFKFLVSGF
jgi:hypothetical protein